MALPSRDMLVRAVTPPGALTAVHRPDGFDRHRAEEISAQAVPPLIMVGGCWSRG